MGGNQSFLSFILMKNVATEPDDNLNVGGVGVLGLLKDCGPQLVQRQLLLIWTQQADVVSQLGHK